MQAVTILLLELFYQNTHMPAKDEKVFLSVKKLMRWLRATGENDPISKRAYQVVHNILRSCSPPFQDLAREIIAHDNNDTQQPSLSPSASGGPTFMTHWSPSFLIDLSNPGFPSFQPQFIPQPPMLSDFGFQGDSKSFPAPISAQYPPSLNNPFVMNYEHDVAMLLSLQDLWSAPVPALTDDYGLVFEYPEQQLQDLPLAET